MRVAPIRTEMGSRQLEHQLKSVQTTPAEMLQFLEQDFTGQLDKIREE